MPAPYGVDMHVDEVLTSFSIEYGPKSQDYIADKVFPTVPTKHKTNIYRKWSKSDLRRTDVKRRAPGTEAPKTGWSFSHDTFAVQNYAVRHDIDDQERANADSSFGSIDQRATKRLTRQMMLFKELQWSASYFKEGVWGRDLEGVDKTDEDNEALAEGEFLKWDNSLSNPRKDMQRWVQQMVLDSGGFKPNFAVIGQDVMTQLEEHPRVLEMYKYTRGGVLTQDLLASYIGLPKLYVPNSSYTDVGFEGDAATQDALAAYKWIFSPTSILLGYAPSSPSVDEPSAGYCFNWTGYPGGNGGIHTRKWRNEPIRSDSIEVESAWDFRVVCKDMGIFMQNVVDPLN